MTGTAINGALYFASPPSNWISPGRETIAETPDRSALVLGTYIPDHTTCGLLPGWTINDLTPVYPSGSTGQITITTPGPYRNMVFWGEVNMKSPTEPLFVNCAFPGMDPRDSPAAVIKCYGTGFYQFRLEDCLVDAGIWKDPTINFPPGKSAIPTFLQWDQKVCNINGIHGGRFTALRCELVNVGDSWSQTQAMTGPTDTSFGKIEQSWMHGNAYYFAADWATVGVQSDGNHADNVQITRGRNITIRGNRIGGHRDEAGYAIYPADPSGFSYNAGDDAWNSGIIFTQQVGNDDNNRIGNVLVELNFFEGGKYGINMPYSTTYPHLFVDTSVVNNYFVRRNDGTGNGALQVDGNYARYVTRTSTLAHCFDNNRVIDTDGLGNFTVGELIVYKNG
jgi:hypothetical protein